MRGGNRDPQRARVVGVGRSPRARGKRVACLGGIGAQRSIPACAGETPRAKRSSATTRVDPRVRGGNGRGRRACPESRGRSPRARGKRCKRAGDIYQDGSIPACARQSTRARGRSPRARGKLLFRGVFCKESRSIPACAGETSAWRQQRKLLKVDPRVRGGNAVEKEVPRTARGRSPRARGKLDGLDRCGAGLRSIPACAGETLSDCWRANSTRVDPRVRGGNLGGNCYESAARGKLVC